QVATQVAQTLGPEHHHDDGQQDQKLPDTDSTKHNYLYLSLAPNRYLIMHQIPARRRAPFGMTRKPMAATDFSHIIKNPYCAVRAAFSSRPETPNRRASSACT